MQSFITQLRGMIAQRIELASPREVLAIAGGLIDDEIPEDFPRRPIVAALGEDLGFVKMSAAGDPLPTDAPDWAAVYDHRTNLMWPRRGLDNSYNWADSKKAAADFRRLGMSDWRLPTVRELSSLVDYDRKEPAIDTNLFDCESSYYWTSTVAQSSPSDYAWCVGFYGGYVSWDSQDGGYFVRPVRVGQY